MPHRIVWFDIPVKDLRRAMQFYSATLDVEIKEEFPGCGVMSHGPGDVAGCLFQSEDIQPSRQGILVYFNVDGRLQDAVDAAAKHGGEIEQGPHQIGPFGHRALIIDSEGNRIALHSES